MFGGILGYIFGGLVIGILARLIKPGADPIGWILTIILGIAVFAEDRRGALYALPFAVGGVTLAGYHTALVAGWVPQWWIPCGSGPSCSQQALVIFDDIQLPWLSLAAFVAITLTLTLYLQRTRT